MPAPANDSTALMAALRGQDPVEAGSGGWTVVVGGMATEVEAETTARQFRLQGYRTAVLKGTTAQGAEIYRVGLGHFRTRADAQAALGRMRGNLFPADAWLLSLR